MKSSRVTAASARQSSMMDLVYVIATEFMSYDQELARHVPITFDILLFILFPTAKKILTQMQSHLQIQ